MIKKILKQNKMIILFVLLLFSVSCDSSRENKEETTQIKVQITTLIQNELIIGTNVTLGGEIINSDNIKIIKRGVCWSEIGDPVIGIDNFKEDNKNESGKYYIYLTSELKAGRTYSFRAYCETSNGIQYGNTINASTGSTVDILPPTDILTRSVKFRGKVIQKDGKTSTVGFVFSKNQTPTINDYVTSKNITGTADYDIDYSAAYLLPNTIYYVRGFIKNDNGTYLYTEQKQFRTTGYFGPAQGYVAYDKGEMIDGWRYLEILPQSLRYNSSDIGSKWGQSGNYIAGTSPQFGKGLENTLIIVQKTTQADCAARLCYNLVKNGYSDWFLPSSEELLTIIKSLDKANIYISTRGWTSTQKDAGDAYSLHYNSYSNPGQYEIGSSWKNWNDEVYAIRRY